MVGIKCCPAPAPPVAFFIEDTAQGRVTIALRSSAPLTIWDQLPQTDWLFVAFVSVKITDAGMGEAVTLRTLTGANATPGFH